MIDSLTFVYYKWEIDGTKLTAEVWKATTETKSSDVFFVKGRKADELRRPEKSVNPFPLACIITREIKKR